MIRKPWLSLRGRVLATSFLLSGAAVAGMTAYGLSFGQVLRTRARENCERMAETFGSVAHDRVTHLDDQLANLAQALEQAGDTGLDRSPAIDAKQVEEVPGAWDDGDGSAAPGSWPTADFATVAGALMESWAVYDAQGHLLAGRVGKSLEESGIGTPEIAPRERGRLAEALSGRPAVVLVARDEHIYALGYRPVRRPGQPAQALQAAVEIAGPTFYLPGQGREARAILRPYMVAADTPHVVSFGDQSRLLVHQPFLYRGRQLGTIAVAVPYDSEIRYENRVTLIIAGVALAALVVLGLVSYFLADVAMVPLARVRRFINDLQSGEQVELTRDVPPDEAGALLEAYQRVRQQSQEWADRLMESNHALNDLVRGAVEALVNAIEAKDGYTAGHSHGVAETACALGRELGWDLAALEHLRIGALLHDIGKIGINLDILNKPGPLNADEFSIIREHPIIGARILSAIPGCEEVVRIVLGHHERYDGSGYPSGARGEQIPLSARIVAIADVYDALTSARSYRPAFDPSEALAIVVEGQGTLFDPELVAAFLAGPALTLGLAADPPPVLEAPTPYESALVAPAMR